MKNVRLIMGMPVTICVEDAIPVGDIELPDGVEDIQTIESDVAKTEAD